MADAGVKPEVAVIKIAVQDSHNTKTHFKIRANTRLKKVFAAYASKQGVGLDTIRFTLQGDVLAADMTAAEAGIEDGDVLDANREQVGGVDCTVVLETGLVGWC